MSYESDRFYAELLAKSVDRNRAFVDGKWVTMTEPETRSRWTWRDEEGKQTMGVMHQEKQAFAGLISLGRGEEP